MSVDGSSSRMAKRATDISSVDHLIESSESDSVAEGETTRDEEQKPANEDLTLAITGNKKRKQMPSHATPRALKRVQLLDRVDLPSNSHRMQSFVPGIRHNIDPALRRTISDSEQSEGRQRADAVEARMDSSSDAGLASKEPSPDARSSVFNVKSRELPKSTWEATLMLNGILHEQLSESEGKRTQLQDRLRDEVRKADQMKQSARQYRDRVQTAFDRQRQIIMGQKRDLALLNEKKSGDLQEYDEASEYLVRIVTNLSNDLTARDSELNRLRSSLQQQTKASTDKEKKSERAEATLRAEYDLNQSSLDSLRTAHQHLQTEKSDLERYRRGDDVVIRDLERELRKVREQLKTSESRRKNDLRVSSNTAERLQSVVDSLKHDSTDADDTGRRTPLLEDPTPALPLQPQEPVRVASPVSDTARPNVRSLGGSEAGPTVSNLTQPPVQDEAISAPLNGEAHEEMRPAGTNVAITPAPPRNSEQPSRNIPDNASNNGRTIGQQPDGSIVFNVEDFLAETIRLAVPGPIAEKLRTQIRKWKASATEWNECRRSRTPACIESRIKKRRFTWSHGTDKACDFCHRKPLLCVTWVDTEKLRLLPLGGNAANSAGGSTRWVI
ncbi:MAG: hypothetical protein OHK93_006455 [Ramalina farinacea]|uniref:Uncharacterized protein n=1 Tax=Ramalina farinacea TaxID=258253 RepID=A0AA43TWS2_9LECA|nr:hypothetical protein [Ramalina farinacea]